MSNFNNEFSWDEMLRAPIDFDQFLLRAYQNEFIVLEDLYNKSILLDVIKEQHPALQLKTYN